ncbi:MAG: protein-methionine-sulfoxide reductase catalytic subunit MsrP [Helicobacter sp.]|nr:protein-methionine-sulfoxide reductase catalytic subunit MsrP [Helicobacter sp.]
MKKYSLKENLVTDEKIYKQRREILKNTGIIGSALTGVRILGAGTIGAGLINTASAEDLQILGKKYNYKKNPKYKASPETPFSKASTYNNYYEYGFNKDEPYYNAKVMNIDNWSVMLDGEVESPKQIAFEDILKMVNLEERIYRLRCVEAWSMVIPWLGFELRELLKVVKPTSKAKFIKMETVVQQTMSNIKTYIRWPYVEGLRMDEAMHPLTFIAVGMYGKMLPRQNGAPLRLVVPWKYGFKYIKSIVRISFVDYMPRTTWMQLASNEYGFYATVNPNVNHPRWSQASERVIDDSFFPRRRDTEMYNGYGNEVAHLYAGLDLRKNY